MSREDRYARHRLIPGWQQGALSEATVIIIGVGALGNAVAQALALAGVGRLILCDPDVVSESNLSRTPLFIPSDVGRLKVEAAAERLKAIAPDSSIVARPWPLVNGVGLAELRDAGLVVSCLDSRSARLALAGRCNLVQAPLLDGGTSAWGGEIRPYLNPEGGCYGCTLSASDRALPDVPINCGSEPGIEPSRPEAGASAPVSGLIGHWMALLAARYLQGLLVPEEAVAIDGAGVSCRKIILGRSLECPLHRSLGATERLSVSAGDSVGTLRAALPPGAAALAWSPVQVLAHCRKCGHQNVAWQRPDQTPCPHCGRALQVRTTLELEQAPDACSLQTLGVAPREILAVRIRDGLRWYELGAAG